MRERGVVASYEMEIEREVYKIEMKQDTIEAVWREFVLFVCMYVK
jgi:hypothetical protein